MTDELKATKVKAEATYNAAADHYEDGPLSFWRRFGQRTVIRLNLSKGDIVYLRGFRVPGEPIVEVMR